jgi:hypothetical protein
VLVVAIVELNRQLDFGVCVLHAHLICV